MILLIYPKLISATQNKYLEPFIFNSIPISLGFLAGYLESKGVKVKIIDEQITDLSYDLIAEEIRKLDEPKIVGISVLSSTYKRTCQIAQMVKSINNSTSIVIGGIHPSATPEECLKESFFDIVVRREGEETLDDVICTLKNRGDLSTVAGISYRRDSQIIHNPDRPLVLNLDNIPPFPYHLFEGGLDSYKEFGIIVSSRGCPYKCIFCSSRIISQYRYRTHSIDRIIDTVDLLINKYKQTRISFLDDNLLSNRRRFFEIVDIILEKNFPQKARFYICARGKDVNEELCKKLKAANFELAVNFEVGTNRMLKFIKKAEVVEDNINAVLVAKSYGIDVTSVFMFGFPTETQEDRKAAIHLSRRLPIDSVRFNIAVPYPGTELYDIAKMNNRLNIKGKYENFAVQYYIESDDLPYDLPLGEKQKVIFDTFWANLSFYLRPAVLVRNLLSRNFAGHAISINSKSPLSVLKNGILLAVLLIRRFRIISMRRFLTYRKV